MLTDTLKPEEKLNILGHKEVNCIRFADSITKTDLQQSLDQLEEILHIMEIIIVKLKGEIRNEDKCSKPNSMNI